ncbi:S24 family peptidase [Aquimarina muelleri]|uniref:Peptidase S24/S26A/S26B/S26C domain-containing protein n=1 Tax=Aquimarina muelleri TaxID=279356 RepID=A0A918N4T6_9FLAO|nr:S24/S26 family peptidase [Aquimarina muelleri]MCX2761844.1 S24/S26 family peptidase [Aquimarina muelleri]GGX23656.1 hypothetical protein GCM10007384_26090 [Aquimarina muelleri]
MAQHLVTKRILTIMDMILEEGSVKSGSALARSIGYSAQSFDKVKNDGRNFPIDVIYKFFSKYNINPSLVFIDDIWEEHSSNGQGFYQQNTHSSSEVAFYTDIEYKTWVALISIEDIQGYALNHKKDEYIDQLDYMSFTKKEDPSKIVRGFQVKGDDMEPNFFHGDWVFGILKKSYTSIKLNRIYIIVLINTIIVRRIVAVDEEENLLTVSMDNYAYPNHTISLDGVFQIWEVENALKSRFPMPIQTK